MASVISLHGYQSASRSVDRNLSSPNDELKALAKLAVVERGVGCGGGFAHSTRAVTVGQRVSKMTVRLSNAHSLVPVAGCDDSARLADLVFVHGWTGGSHTTWSSNADPSSFWPAWLAADVPRLGVWTFGYLTPATKWGKNSLRLPERGDHLLESLYVAGIGRRPLIFVAHSMGGLIVKEAMVNAYRDARWKPLRRSLRGVAFLATPHVGAAIASMLDWLRPIVRSTASELGMHEPALGRLAHDFRRVFSEGGIICRAYVETQKTTLTDVGWPFRIPAGVLVVDAVSADPQLPNVVPVPIPEASHVTITKPSDRSALIYASVRSFAQECMELESPAPASPETTSSPEPSSPALSPITVEPISGAIRFKLGPPGTLVEQKYEDGGTFLAEITVRMASREGAVSPAIASVRTECVSKRGIRAHTVSDSISVVVDDGGEARARPLAQVEGQLLSPLVVQGSMVLHIGSKYVARLSEQPVDWDNGYLRVICRDTESRLIVDETFVYRGARSVARSSLPEVPRLNDRELTSFLRTGYLSEDEAAVLFALAPDERLLMLWRERYVPFGSELARRAVDSLEERTFVSWVDRREPMFPPPFASTLGTPRKVVIQKQAGVCDIALPSAPRSPTSLVAWFEGLFVSKIAVMERTATLPEDYRDGAGSVIVVYIEGDPGPGLTPR